MGAKQSKRSVDITTTPKKGEGEIIGEGEGKVEKIAELDVKAATTNGAVHPEIEFADKDDSVKDQSADKGDIKENGVSESEDGGKTPEDGDGPQAAGDKINESITTEKTTPTTENNDENKDKSVTVEETTENKKNKEKSKKKKWSFRSISFSKKDKSKPSKDSEKNGDVKEVNEENAAETSPTVETPKTEEAKVPTNDGDSNATPIETTNGDATAEELAKVDDKSNETAITEELAVKEEPAKVPEPAESAPSPIKEEPSKVVEEPTPKVEESKPVVETTNTTTPDNVVEESKEVRTEDVPPPLPSSNPPSPVTVFAESTKADNNLNEIVQPVDALNVANTVDEIPKVVENVDETSNIESITLEEQIPKTEIEPVENIASTEATIGSINSENLPSPSQESIQSSESISDIPLPDVVNANIIKESESLPDQSEKIIPSTTEIVFDKELATKIDPIKESNENNEVDKPKLVAEEPIECCKLEEHKTQDPLPPPVDDKVIEQEQLTKKDLNLQSTLDTSVPKEEIPSNCDNVTQDLPSPATESVPNEDPVQNIDSCPIGKTVVDLLNESSPSQIQDVPPTSEKNPESNENIPLPIQEVLSTPIENPEPTEHVENVSTSDTCPVVLPQKLEPTPIQGTLPTSSENPESQENIPSPIQNTPSPDLPVSIENRETNLTNNADSLPDISTESLPSLPEPVSEGLPEPMSLPPVDSLPEPIVNESPAIIPDPPSDCSPIVDKLPSESPLPTNETVLTNGNMNGLSSPIVTNDEIVPPIEGPLKQVPTEVPESQCEIAASGESTQDSTTATTEE